MKGWSRHGLGLFVMGRRTIARSDLVDRIRAWERSVDGYSDERKAIDDISVIEIDGRRKRYVGIGWVDEGKPDGMEVLVT